jgi:hypothetical protein
MLRATDVGHPTSTILQIMVARNINTICDVYHVSQQSQCNALLLVCTWQYTHVLAFTHNVLRADYAL